MNNISTIISQAGGLLFFLTFVHFFLDWGFQSQKEAMQKHDNSLIRAKHCLIYSFGFLPVMLLLKFSIIEIISGLLILFATHFVLDSYIIVFWWIKYVRKPFEVIEKLKIIDKQIEINNDKEYFKCFLNTNLGLILALVIDQITHIICLIPLVWMGLN